MNRGKDICSISYVKANAAKILEQVNETQRPVYITQSGEARAVLLAPASYERMKEALGLLKLLVQGERDIAEGKIIPQEDCFAAMERCCLAEND